MNSPSKSQVKRQHTLSVHELDLNAFKNDILEDVDEEKVGLDER
jgi:hypothetical protein